MFSPLFEQQNKGKKKKKGGLPGGGLKAKMKDDFGDYGEFDGGYVQDFEDFMWPPLRNPSYSLSDETYETLQRMASPYSQTHVQNQARKLEPHPM